MRLTRSFSIAAYTLSAICWLVPGLQARTCSGNSEVLGSFGFVGSRNAFGATSITPPGTTGASSTAIGSLLAGTTGTGPFGAIGKLQADGTGILFASVSATSNTQIQIGTYTVNGDCTISVTLNDAFVNTSSGSTGSSTTTVTPATGDFQGVVVDNGNEIDLIQTASGSGSVIRLQKTSQNTVCTVANLSGTYGVTGSGVANIAATSGGSGTASAASFGFVGRMFADGAGNIVLDSASTGSALPQRQLTGTYTVSADCTGTASLKTADGTTRGIRFILVNEISACNANGGGAQRQSVQFVFSDAGAVGTGEARQQ